MVPKTFDPQNAIRLMSFVSLNTTERSNWTDVLRPIYPKRLNIRLLPLSI